MNTPENPVVASNALLDDACRIAFVRHYKDFNELGMAEDGTYKD